MTPAAPGISISPRALARRPSAELGALARIEGRRLVCHPAFLVGAALTLLFFRDQGDGATLSQFLDGFGWLPLGSATLIVASLAALRSRRDRTDELYASLPRRRATRTAGQLLGLLWTLPISIAFMAAALVDNRSVVDNPSVPYTPGIEQLATGPIMVLAFGAIGILLARLVPSVIAAPLLVVALVATQVPGFAPGGAVVAWMLPTMAHLAQVMHITCDPGGPGCDSPAYEAGWIGWHLAYVVGLTLVVAAAALVPARRLTAAGLTALALALAVGTKLAAGA